MRIVVSAQAPSLEAKTSPIFGRCPAYVFVDTESGAVEAVANPATSAGGGAGVQAAQFVVSKGTEAVVSGNLGPNAQAVLEAAGIKTYLVGEMTVQDAVVAFKKGNLSSTATATMERHTPLRGGKVTYAAPSRAEELESLRNEAMDLRQRLAKLMDRISQIEKES